MCLKHLFLVTFFLSSFTISFAMFQDAEEDTDTLWTTNSVLSLNLQQIGFNNWAQGGEATLTYGGVLNATATRKDDLSEWTSDMRLGYGLQRIGSAAARKNNDLIILQSKYSRDFNDNWSITASFDFRSQFVEGYKIEEDINGVDSLVLVSNFFSPAYLQPSIGLTYSPGKFFSATIAPISNKITFVLNETLSNQGKYGVDPGQKVRSQLGATVNVSFNKEVMENVLVKSNLLLFGDYANPEIWDVNYDLFIDFKINKWFTTNFLLQAIYDDDITGNHDDESITGPALQIRNVWNLGITLTLIE